MRTTFAFVCLVSALQVAAASGRAEEVAGLPVHVQRLDPATVRVWLGDHTSSTAVVAFATAKGIVVVDTMGFPKIDREVRKVIAKELGRNDFAVLINTHEHGDHTGGNAAYAACTIVAHELCGAGMARQRGDQARVKEWLTTRTAELEGEIAKETEPAKAKALKEDLILERLSLESFDAGAPPAPAKTFADRTTLNMGDTTFELYYTGGMHTSSDIAVLVPERGVLLTGDTMADVWFNDTPGCLAAFMARPGVRHDFPRLLDNWAALLARKDEIKDVVPGHWNGDVTIPGFEARYAYVKTLWEGVQGAAAQGKGLAAVFAEYRLDTKFPDLVESPGFGARNNTTTITEMWTAATGQESAAARLYALIDEGAGREAIDEVLGERGKKDAKYYFLEADINGRGYAFLQQEQVDKAVAMFRLNAELFPGAWNVYDSLGEALLRSGDTAGAREMYERSVALNPDNSNGKEALARIAGGAAPQKTD